MIEETAIVIGASGLIGSHLVEELLKDAHFVTVRVLVRKKIELNHPKLEQIIVDFNDIHDYTSKFGKGHSIFCCIGTTTKKVNRNINAYRKIDIDIPVNAARIGIAKNFSKYLVVSSAGANANSKNFYLKLKGELENSLKEFSFHSISIFRPGQLLGKRNEDRKGEALLQNTTKFFSFFLFGDLKKYHSIKAGDVAKAMIAESKQLHSGVHILEYKEMMKLINLTTSDPHQLLKPHS